MSILFSIILSVVLSPFFPVSEQMTKANTTYVVKSKIDLHGSTVIVPDGCTLVFKRGCFYNGTIEASGVYVQAPAKRMIFAPSVQLKGAFNAEVAYSKWVGLVSDCLLDGNGRCVRGTDNYAALRNLFCFNNINIAKGSYYYHGHLCLARSNQHLEGNGSVLKARYQSYALPAVTLGPQKVSSPSEAVSDITVNNITLIGYRLEGTDVTEWAHAFTVQNAKNVTLSNVKALFSRGDGVNITETRFGNEFWVPENITVSNLYAEGNHRLGLSVTGGRHVRILNSTFVRNEGTDPQAGIDIEPNYFKVGSRLVGSECQDIVVENCTFVSNGLYGMLIQAPEGYKAGGYSPIDGMTVRNCTFTDDGITIRQCKDVAFQNCSISVGRGKNGVVLEDASHSDLSFENLNITNKELDAPSGVGFYVLPGQSKCNISLRNVTVSGGFEYGLFIPDNNGCKNSISGLTLSDVTVSNCWHNAYIGNTVRNASYHNVNVRDNGRNVNGKNYKDWTWSWDINKGDDKRTRKEVK